MYKSNTPELVELKTNVYVPSPLSRTAAKRVSLSMAAVEVTRNRFASGLSSRTLS